MALEARDDDKNCPSKYNNRALILKRLGECIKPWPQYFESDSDDGEDESSEEESSGEESAAEESGEEVDGSSNEEAESEEESADESGSDYEE